MNIRIHSLTIFVTLSFLLPGMLMGQPGRTQTPESIQYETRFIEAQKQKILGNKEKAIEILEKLTRDVDTIGGVYYELARIYGADNNYDKALKNIGKAVELKPAFQPFWEIKAKLEVKAGENKKAAASYAKLMKLAPNEQLFYEKRAHCFERMDEHGEAVAIWDSIEMKFGFSEASVRKKHMLYHNMGKTDEALQELQEWVDRRPKQTHPLYQLAQYQQQIGRKEAAMKTYERILELDPEQGKARLAMLSLNKSEGDDRSFLNSLEPILRDDEAPVDSKIREMIPYVEKLADGDTSLTEGLKSLSAILRELHGGEAKSWSISGDIAYYTGAKERAAEYYKATVDRNPRVFPVWEQLLRTLAETHQYEQLTEQAERARDYFPNQGLILYFQGLGYFGTGAYDEAEEILDEALLISSASPEMQADMYALLSAVASRKDDLESAEEYIEKGLNRVANHPDLLLQKASVMIRKDHPLDQARDLLDKVDKMVPHTVEMAHLRGWIELKKGNLDTASELLNKALGSSNYPSPELLEHYGDLLKQQGAPQEAKKYWEQALEQGGNRSQLEQKLQALPE